MLKGRTAHSRFKIPLNLTPESQSSITSEDPDWELLLRARMVVWDEAQSMHRRGIEFVSSLLQGIAEQAGWTEAAKQPFGGKVIVFSGDFRQHPPVVPQGTRSDIVAASLRSSPLWKYIERYTMKKNMRARFDQPFCKWLADVGNASKTFKTGL